MGFLIGSDKLPLAVKNITGVEYLIAKDTGHCTPNHIDLILLGKGREKRTGFLTADIGIRTYWPGIESRQP